MLQHFFNVAERLAHGNCNLMARNVRFRYNVHGNSSSNVDDGADKMGVK